MLTAKAPHNSAIQTSVYLTLCVLVGLFFILPKMPNLGQYATADEPLYVRESGDFYYAITHGMYTETNRIAHPGVTVMWLGSAAFLWQFPEYKDVATFNPADLHFSQFLERRGLSNLEMLVAGRLMMILFQAGLAVLIFQTLWRLFPATTAIVAIGILLFDPFLFAHTRILGTDGLFSMLMLLTLVAYLDYLRHQNWKALIISAIAGGLSALTKTPGLFLLPFMGASIFLTWLITNRKANIFQQVFKPYLVWLGVVLITFVLLWPAMWTTPLATLSDRFGFAFESLEGLRSTRTYFKGDVIPDGNLDNYADFYLLNFLWRTTPVVLVGIGLLVIGLIAFRKEINLPNFFHIFLFGLLFISFINLSGKRFDRYITPSFAAFDLLAGMGWGFALKMIGQIGATSRQKITVALVALAIVGSQAFFTAKASPYYLASYNPWMGGSEKAADTMLIGWGEGLDQAARYLNQKPDRLEMEVIAWYPSVFNYYFVGKASGMPIEGINPENLENRMQADYLVIYFQQEQRQAAANALDYVADFTPEHVIFINEMQYVKIYNLNEIREK